MAPAVAEGATLGVPRGPPLPGPHIPDWSLCAYLAALFRFDWGPEREEAMTTAIVKVTKIQNGFELAVQEPINVRAVLLRDGERAWSLDTIDAIDGVFLSERYVMSEIVDEPVDPQERARREEAAAQDWAIEALGRALQEPRIHLVA